MRVDENTYKIIQKAKELTDGVYDIYWKDSENIDGYIETDTLLSIIDDLIWEVKYKDEELEDLKNDLDSNYVRVSISDQVDISDRDFI